MAPQLNALKESMRKYENGLEEVGNMITNANEIKVYIGRNFIKRGLFRF